MTRVAGLAIGFVGDEISRGRTAVIVSRDDAEGRTVAAVDHRAGSRGRSADRVSSDPSPLIKHVSMRRLVTFVHGLVAERRENRRSKCRFGRIQPTMCRRRSR